MALNRLLVTLIRHGESQDNQQGIWAGFRDTPLTPHGVSQARALGQSFANVPLTAIYCSDLKRAAMTADEILKSNRSIPPPPLVQSRALREINFGQAEGQSYASTEWMQGSTGDDARNFRFPEGESLEEVNARIAKAVRQFILPRVEALRKKPPSEQAAGGEVAHICIVAHGIAIAELLRVFMALHDGSSSSPWSDPKTSYQRVRLENTGWSRLELAVPAQVDGSLLSDADNASPNKINAASSTSLLPPGTTSAHPGAQSEYADFGEVQADLVEGPVDATSKIPSKSPLPPSTESTSRPVYVRIICQNQTDHLRGFSSQQGSGPAAAKTVAHLAGGGAATKSSVGAGSGTSATSTNPSASAAAVGLPASATLASIASNATSSHAHTNTAMGPSTPAPGAASSANNASKSFTATPASTRSLNSYDPRMMARELERAGAASMLAGSDAGPSSSASNHYPSPTTAPTGTADRQSSTGAYAGPSSSVGTSSGLDRGGVTSSPGVGGSLSTPHASSQLSGAYPQAASASVAGATSPNPAGASFSTGTGTSSDTWQMVCIRVLPLFNGEALRTSIEELNEMVSLHVRKTLDRGQSHAVESLTLDIMSLASTGTLTINSKLQGLEDTRLLLRLVEVWTFFLGQVLPYCEACFLPIQTDPTLRNLIAASSSYGTAAGGAGGGTTAASFNGGANLTQTSTIAAAGSNCLGMQRIDVRKLLLIVFRDQVLFPIQERLFHLFARLTELDPAFAAAEDTNSSGGGGSDDGFKQVSLRLLQMTSVLASILSEDEPQEAMDNLLRALRLGSKSTSTGRNRGTADGSGARAASPTQRNNRRGWMAQKARKHGLSVGSEGDANAFAYGNGLHHLPQAGTLGSHTGQQASFLTRPSHLTSVRDALGPRFGSEMTEDEYLTSLRSPAGSPAISTPGQPEAPATPAVDSATTPSSSADDHLTHHRSGDDRAAATTISTSRSGLPTNPTEGEQTIAPTALAA